MNPTAFILRVQAHARAGLCTTYGHTGALCALPAGHPPIGDGRVHELVQR